MEFRAGDVVLVPFPYRDRLAESARPAVVVFDVAYNRHGNVVDEHGNHVPCGELGRQTLLWRIGPVRV